MPQIKHKKKLSQHVDKRILFRARLFGVLSIIFLVILINDFIVGSISVAGLVIGVAIGVVIGIVASRTYHLSWNADGKKVVGRLDGLGTAVLILYIFFAIYRKPLVGTFVHGPMVGTEIIAVMTGLFIGQIVGTRNGIRGILRDEGIIK